jgi:hypothetical protein
MGGKRNRRALAAARASGEPVRLERSLARAERMEGFVVDIGEAWVLLHRVTGLRLDGWSAVRLDTARAVDRLTTLDIVTRAVAAHGETPRPIDIDLTGPAEIVRSMWRLSPLVTVHREAKWPDECSIGRPTRLGPKKVDLLEIDPQASWDREPRRFGLRKLTRIEIGGDYEHTLHQLGGAPPGGPPWRPPSTEG